MNEEKNSLRLALATWITRGVVRAWPDETKRWAHAFRAELAEIERPGASLRWALGGIMLLTRAWWNHLLRSWNRPAGVPEAGPLAELARNASRVPRTPRFVTAILLAASLAMLAVPDVRQGITATFHAWSRNYDWGEEGGNQAVVARLRSEGEKRQDPQALALVALLSKDRGERLRLADHAVSQDPSITWIYAYVRTTDGPYWWGETPIQAVWLDKLQKWDPDNAFPRLLVAHQIYIRYKHEWDKNGSPGAFDLEVKKKVQGDPAWIAAMEAAFSEPKFDHYYDRLFDLYRAVAWRYGIQDASVTTAVLFSRYSSSAARMDIGIYSDLLEGRAAAAEQAGNFKEAERLYEIPAQYGQRMAAQVHSDNDRALWQGIQNTALRKLQPLLVKSHRADEAALVDVQISALQVERNVGGPAQLYSRIGNGWEGFMIRSFTAGIFVLGILSLVSVMLLFLRRRAAVESRGFGMSLASLGVDYCPLLLLFSCAGLYVAYRPVALMIDRYMTWPVPIFDFNGLWQALFTPYGSPEGIDRIFYAYLTPPNLWMALIVALSTTAVFILLRGVLRKREAIAH